MPTLPSGPWQMRHTENTCLPDLSTEFYHKTLRSILLNPNEPESGTCAFHLLAHKQNAGWARAVHSSNGCLDYLSPSLSLDPHVCLPLPRPCLLDSPHMPFRSALILLCPRRLSQHPQQPGSPPVASCWNCTVTAPTGNEDRRQMGLLPAH